MSGTSAFKICRHCKMEYPVGRARGCKCDGERCSLIKIEEGEDAKDVLANVRAAGDNGCADAEDDDGEYLDDDE